MLYTIDNYQILEKQALRWGDYVNFVCNDTLIGYKVERRWLEIVSHPLESLIFEQLGIVDHIQFCSDYYGYPARDVAFEHWPDSHLEDYPALTRVVIALFDIIAGKLKIPQCKKLELTPIDITIL